MSVIYRSTNGKGVGIRSGKLVLSFYHMANPGSLATLNSHAT